MMANDKIMDAVRNGELIVTSKDIIHEAVKQSISELYKDDGDFGSNRYVYERTFEKVSKEDIEEITNEIWDYIS